jgi:MFS family permease
LRAAGFSNDTGIFSKQQIAKTFAIASPLSWFFVLELNFGTFFQHVTNDKVWVFAGGVLFFVFGILSTFLGAYLSKSVNRRKLLLFSVSIGVLSTLSLAIFHGNVFSLLLGSLLGFSYGIGFPSAGALFSDQTKTGSLGRLAGILVLVTFILVAVGTTFAQITTPLELITMAVVLRALGFLPLVVNPSRQESRKENTWSSILRKRDIVLYMLPWIMFNLVSGLSNFIYPDLLKNPDFISAINLGNITQFLGVAVFSLISGYVCDRFGRKPPIVVGILMFGISFAILGVAPSPLSVIFQETVFGVAWGFCMVAYLAIAADLSGLASREKYYALINILSFAGFSLTFPMPIILGISAPVSILSPVLSILLFVSIAPILFVSETLPETEQASRRLREHLARVEKEVAKSKKRD